MKKNFNEQPSLSNEILREYDGLIGLTMLNTFLSSKEDGVIRLFEFDRKNREHLYLLRVALLVRSVYQFPVEVDCSGWDLFVLNFKIRKGFAPIKKIGWYTNKGIKAEELLEKMRPDATERLGDDFSFGDIYDCYYKGSIG